MLWKSEDTNGALGMDVEDVNTKKEAELTLAAEKLELKRKMSSKWLAKCKRKEKFK